MDQKKQKLKDLLKRLDALESSLPKDETLGLVEQIIGEKYKDITAKVKDDSSLQALEAINGKLDKFKRDFNLAPVIQEINALHDSLDQMQESVVSQFDQTSQSSDLTKSELTNLIESTKSDIQGMTGKELASVLKKISSLEEQLSFQDDTSQNQGQTLKGIVADFETRIESLVKDFKESKTAGETSTKATAQTNSEAIKKLSDEIEKLRKELLSRISNIGGGNMNRQIRVEGVDVLTKYTDINFYGVTSSVISSVDNTNKRVNIGVQGGGGGIPLTPTGTVNGSNASFTVSAEPKYVVSDGTTYFDGAGYTYAALTITMDSPPSQYIRYFI